MTAILGWVIFVAGLLGASAVIIVPVLLCLRRIFPNWRPGLVAPLAAVTSGAIALWFVIPLVIHAGFGSG